MALSTRTIVIASIATAGLLSIGSIAAYATTLPLAPTSSISSPTPGISLSPTHTPGADDPANHDANDDNGVDNPATHDINDDHGGQVGGHGADDPAGHDANDDHGGTGNSGQGGSGGGHDESGSGHGGGGNSGGGHDRSGSGHDGGAHH